MLYSSAFAENHAIRILNLELGWGRVWTIRGKLIVRARSRWNGKNISRCGRQPVGYSHFHSRQCDRSRPIHGKLINLLRLLRTLCKPTSLSFNRFVTGRDIPHPSGSALLLRWLQNLGSHDHDSTWIVS